MKSARNQLVIEKAVTITAREFVRVWQTSNSVAEVAKQVQRTKNAVRVRAFRYREMGVPLKQFPALEIEPINWDELAEFASTCHLSETAQRS